MSYKFNDIDHLHELDGQPLTGVSSVGNVVSKPLTYWAAGLALVPFGWTKDKDDDGKYVPKSDRLNASLARRTEIRNLTEEEYLKLLDSSYRAHAQKLKTTAEAGTDRHALVEKYVKLMIADQDGSPKNINDKDNPIEPFIAWAMIAVKKFLVSEAHCYSRAHWVGGIVDIVAELKNETIAIIDIKSSKDAYPAQFFQCGGYDILLSENGAFTKDGEKMFDLGEKKVAAHIVFPFGMKNPTAKVRYDVDKNREAFLAELTLYRQINNFNK